MEDGAREEELFELIKGLLTSRGPIPVIVFLGEIKEGAGNCRVVGDEPTIEIDKVKEGSYILDFGWGGPGGDAIELDWVHGKLPWFHNHSKVFYLRDVKLAFLEL